MYCVMTIAQEHFKANLYHLNMRRNCSCPFARCGKIWGIQGNCDRSFRHL
jgi:hypothetical protein